MGNLFGDPFGMAGQLGGAAISAGASITNNALTNKTNREIADSNNQTSIQIAKENNELQQQMNTENNQFAHDEAQLSFDRAVEQWQRENQYNSPVEQLKRFQEAGINPTLGLLGSSALPAASSPSPVLATPHGSGISPSMPSLQQAIMNPFDIGDSIMKAVTALSNARKTGVETKTLQQTMDSIISKAKEDARFAENQADLAEFNNYLQSRYGECRFNAETQKILDESYQATSLAFKALRDGDLAVAEKQRELAHRDVLKLDKELKVKERDSWEEMYDLKKKQIIADTKESSAQAEKAHEEALTEGRLRELRHDLFAADLAVQQEAKNEIIRRTEKLLKESNLIPQGADADRIREVLRKQMDEDLKSKEFGNSFTGRYILPFLNNAERAAGNVISAMVFKGKI